jgi:hypothetical protein
MSDLVQGSAASPVTTVPSSAGPYEGPESPGRPQPLTPQVSGISREGTVPRASVPTPSVPRPSAPTPVAPALVTARTAEVRLPQPVTSVPVTSVPVTSVPVTSVPVTSVPVSVRAADQLPHPSPCRSRASVRDELDDALSGAPLNTRDRQFLSKLVHWDKRNAASVVTLLRRARHAGRNEAGLTPLQLETVLTALKDAVVHRVAGVDTVGCWDCEKVLGGRCAEHSRDFERARDYADLAALLSACASLPQLDNELRSTELAPTPIQRPTDISGYRRRAPIVS